MVTTTDLLRPISCPPDIACEKPGRGERGDSFPVAGSPTPSFEVMELTRGASQRFDRYCPPKLTLSDEVEDPRLDTRPATVADGGRSLDPAMFGQGLLLAVTTGDVARIARANGSIRTFRYGKQIDAKSLVREVPVLQKVLDLDPLNSDFCTLLHFASLAGRIPIIDLLVEQHDLIGVEHPWAVQPIHFAALGGQIDAYNTLCAHAQLKGMPDPRAYYTGYGWNHFQFALIGGSVPMVRQVIEEAKEVFGEDWKQELDKPDSNGNIAAHHATRCGNVEVLKLLQEEGLDMEAPNRQGYAPWHLFPHSAHPQATYQFFESIKAVDITHFALHQYRQMDYLPAPGVSRLEELQSTRCCGHFSIFHIIALSRPTEELQVVTRKLIETHRETIHTHLQTLRDFQRATPIHYAAFAGNGPILRLLCELLPALQNETDSSKRHPAKYALAGSHVQTLYPDQERFCAYERWEAALREESVEVQRLKFMTLDPSSQNDLLDINTIRMYMNVGTAVY